MLRSSELLQCSCVLRQILLIQSDDRDQACKSRSSGSQGKLSGDLGLCSSSGLNTIAGVVWPDPV